MARRCIMSHWIRSALAALLVTGVLATDARAAVVMAGPSTVQSQSMLTYTYMSSGDVVFQLTTNSLPQCAGGFWLRASDPGFKNAVAVLLSVVQAQGTLAVWVDDSQIWTGSTSPYCLVYNLQL